MDKTNPTLEHIARFIEESGLDGAEWDARYRCFGLCKPPDRTLPVYGWHEHDLIYDDEAAGRFLSYSRCLRERRPVKEGEPPAAWKRVQHGFSPLFDRAENA